MDRGNGQNKVRSATVAAVACAAAALATAATALAAPGDPPQAGAPVTAEFVPGEVLVRFEHGVPAREKAELRDELGADIAERLPIPRVQLLELDEGSSVREAVAGLEAAPGVDYAEPNFKREAAVLPNDPQFSRLWGLHNEGQPVPGISGPPLSGSADADIDAPGAWDITTGSGDITVAVIDTGVAYDHADLASNIWTNAGEQSGVPGVDDDGNGKVDDVRGWDFVDGDNDPMDHHGHGTHVAGTIGAVGNNAFGVTGVNWDVSLMPLRALDAVGAGSTALSAEAIAFAGEAGADVVNGSYSGSGFSNTEKLAIDSAPSTVFVFAAGNGGADGIGDNNDQAQVTPCNYASPNVICVAATDLNDQLTAFSNFGATNVDLAAPGARVWSTYPFEDHPPLLSEGFESGLGAWTTTGSWGLSTAFKVSGAQSLTDSPSGNYANSASSFARTTNPIDMTGQSDCELRSPIRADTADAGDTIKVQASTDGTSWTDLTTISGPTGNPPRFLATVDEMTAFEGSSAVFLRYLFETNGTGVDDGVYIDAVLLRCRADVLEPFNGTSMATPHVAGAAALLFAQDPSASVAEVRDAILNSVDQKAALCGKVATAGRLNAARALAGDVNGPPCQPAPAPGSGGETGTGSTGSDAAPPDTRITSGPPNKTKKKQATFAFTSTEPGSGFACAVDGQALKAPCTSPFTVRVKKGKHTFQVRATDASGNADPTPASDSWKRKKKK